jgi:hypothetical protein
MCDGTLASCFFAILERSTFTAALYPKRGYSQGRATDLTLSAAICAMGSELLKRTFDFDVLSCPSCNGRMKLLALVTDSKGSARYLRALGEPTDVPRRSPSRGPPFWRSTVLRRKALGDIA